MSSGLTYTPGMYAPDAELTELCRVVASYGGYYCPRHRSYGAGALEAYAEMVALTREAGCPLHLAHATMNFGVNKGRAPELLALLTRRWTRAPTSPWTPIRTPRAARPSSPCCRAGRARAARRRSSAASPTTARPSGSATTWRSPAPDGCHGVPVEWDTIEITGIGEYQRWAST
ncbi:N-acyl-D-amino-acid deacylase OS=Streptomyces albaduncus OX=68172 GN=FHS32_001101 PE=4 SV=1 [Streptomyces griseoloalbus]